MKKTFKAALIVLLLVVLWIVAGYVMPGEKTNKQQNSAQLAGHSNGELSKVRIVDSTAINRTKTINLIGITKASKVVEIKPEVSGKVDKILADEGKLIKKDEVILIVEKRNRQAKLEELEAKYEQTKITYESSKKLSISGLQSKSRVAQAKSEMEAARAGLIQAEIDYGNTVIKAPFTGILEKIDVEVGDYLQVGFGGGGGDSSSSFAGKSVAKIIDNTPYIVEAGVSERLISQVKEGDEAVVKLVDGTESKGVVTYISKIADQQTRSFKVEITVDDEVGAASGITASVTMSVGEQKAHKVPASALSLDPDGKFGIKYLEVVEELSNGQVMGNVKFHPIAVYDSDIDGLWVTGLDDNIKLITLGGAFVEIGAEVLGIFKESENPSNG